MHCPAYSELLQHDSPRHLIKARVLNGHSPTMPAEHSTAQEQHSCLQLVSTSRFEDFQALAHLVDKEHPWHDLCLPFLAPLQHAAVNLLAHLLPNLPRVPGK